MARTRAGAPVRMQIDATPAGSGAGSAGTWLMALLDLPLLAAGMLAYALTGRTPRLAYHSMRRLSGATNGRLNRAWLAFVSWWRPARPRVAVDGFLGRLEAQQIEAIAARLHADGYCPLEQVLPEAMCDALLEFALSQPSLPMGGGAPTVYSPDTASALRHDFDESVILRSPAACRIVFDGTLAAIAAAYFRARPLYDFTAMWWTTARGARDLSKAAQEFHYDMDRPYFLKFFFYLTDVDAASGPHVFVPGSHRDKPAPLRAPRRFSDEEIRRHYPGGRVLEILGRRGTAFAVDTSAFHKGMPIVEGHRLALQVEFTISRFGQNYKTPTVSRAVLEAAGVAVPPDPDVFRVQLQP